MLLNFAEAIRQLGEGAAMTIANAARPLPNYLFGTILPEVNRPDYSIDLATMTVRATTAGLAAMDSPYPQGGFIELGVFMAESAKIANQVDLPEKVLRELQQIVVRRIAMGESSIDFVQTQVLNFLQKVVIQAHIDTMEWLRGKALNNGEIDWTFNKKNLKVNYGIPAANFLTPRTGNDAYNGSASKFWTDVKDARRILRNNLRAVIAHPTTIDAIVYNDVNKAEVIGEDNGTFTIRRLIGDNERPSQDARQTVQLISYDLEVEKLNGDGTTTLVPVQPIGDVLFLANNTRSGYRVGEGSTDDPQNDFELGYTHIAPTTEGGGEMGRWADVFTPEREPYKLVGRGVSNALPVLEAPKKIVRARTTVA